MNLVLTLPVLSVITKTDQILNFYEMVDGDLDNLAGRVLGNMDLRTITLVHLSWRKHRVNADYSVFIENAFSDTHGDGTVENYSIYQRVTMQLMRIAQLLFVMTGLQIILQNLF